jgi:hypothetical protein
MIDLCKQGEEVALLKGKIISIYLNNIFASMEKIRLSVNSAKGLGNV